MSTTKFIRGVDPTIFQDCYVVATFGNFDGLHLGHQEILREMMLILCSAKSKAPSKRLLSLVIGFHPHPAKVLGRVSEVLKITTLRQSIDILSGFDIDYLCYLRFNQELLNLSAADFAEQVLLGELNISGMVVGGDSCFGKNREGDTNLLKTYFSTENRDIRVLNFQTNDHGTKISSRQIRTLISDGKVDEAHCLLGRPFKLDGRVGRGQRLGQKLGFPTLNLTCLHQILPSSGVYVTEVETSKGSALSVTNIGVRPTVSGTGLSVECHAIEQELGSLYGERVSVKFLKRLRSEKKFDSVDQLKTQIREDIELAKKIQDMDK